MTASKNIVDFLTQSQKEMITFLADLVCIQSGSKNKSGIDKVAGLIQEEMTAMGFLCERIRQKNFGDHIIARSPFTRQSDKQVLITGHMDTVFPSDTDFNFFKQGNQKCYGPGVADMKGGLVVGMFALKALAAAGLLEERPITFVFNSDEEIGSPSSRQLIREQAKKSCVGFVLEAGGLNGEVVTGRKGNLSAVLEINGEAGHAAFVKKNKASAVLELAKKTIAIEKLNDVSKGISANVGTVKGGIGPNTIPAFAAAQMDFRFLTLNDFNALESRINRICRQTDTLGTTSDLKIVSSRPPMPQTKDNMALFDTLKTIAGSLDIQVTSELRQGVSDANIMADEGIPVLDGLGPVGDKDHSEDEYIVTQSLLERTVLFAHLLSSFPAH